MIRNLLTALLVSVAATSASISTCGSNNLFTVNSMSLTPDPPIIGQNTTMSITYTNPGPAITGGTAKYSISYNGLPYSSTDDLCKATECPIEIGEHIVTSSALWDGSLSGKIATTIQWSDQTGAPLMCIQLITKS
jgi:hypothetical protein